MTDDSVERDRDVGEVFISYSWDTEDHVRAVLALSNRLRSEGVDCVLDQYEESPPEGWPRWMDRKIKNSRFVLMICTETYYKRVMGDEAADKGLGVKWEGGLIYQYIYNAGSNQKFIPVLLRERDKRFIPTPLQSATHYQVDIPVEYDKLYARLLGRPNTEKPKLGPVRPFPKRQVKTDISMYVTGPIDVDLWNKAKWRATFMMCCEDAPPILGLGFLNENPARQIFEQWHKRYGSHDHFEELRVSIIEGEIKGEAPGYSVYVSADFENTIKRYKDAGLTVNRSDIFATIGRINRMNPDPSSKNLQIFKQAYRRHKTYLLIPGTIDEDGSNLKPMVELGVFKNSIHFRNVDEIGSNDPDTVVLGSGGIRRPLTSFGKRIKRKKKP